MIIETLDEFMKWAETFNKGEYLFRGVSRSSYIVEGKIEASAYRRLPEEARRPERLLELNQALIENARLQGHAQRNGQDLSDLDLLAELQHFGAATCLIDFTSNALVALWFACKQSAEGKPKNGAVVVLRSDGLEPLKRVDYNRSQQEIQSFFKQDAAGRYPLYRWQPKFQNNRILSQQSVFVFGGARIEIAGECEIEESCKPVLLTALEEVSGITGASLFSDFDGFAWLHAHDKPYLEPTAKAYRLRGIDASSRGSETSAKKEDRERAIHDFDEAIKSFDEAIKFTPETARGDTETSEVFIHRAWAYRCKATLCDNPADANENWDLAIADYNRAMSERSELKPDFLPKVHNLRGIVYLEKGELDKAIEDFNTAINLDGNLAKAYSNRGFAYFRRRDFERAIEDFTAAINMRADYSLAYCNRGEAWLHRTEWDEAREDLTQAKKMGVDIIDSFQNEYKDVEEFKEKNRIEEVPADIVNMLTLP